MINSSFSTIVIQYDCFPFRMIASTGPTNTRKYTVAVYFRTKRLATGTGHSIQMAEMAAATNALRDKSGILPLLYHKVCEKEVYVLRLQYQ